VSPDGRDGATSQATVHPHREGPEGPNAREGREGREGMKAMEDKRPTRPQTGHPNGDQHAREPLKLLRGNPRVRALLSSLVSTGGSTNWR
jgi:hypothetical protein